MKQRAAALIADYVGRRGIGRVSDSSLSEATTTSWRSRTYVTNGSTSAARQGTSNGGFGPSRKAVTVLPAFGLCGRCGEIHCDRDLDLEIFRTCIPCQAELVEVGLKLYCEQESE